MRLVPLVIGVVLVSVSAFADPALPPTAPLPDGAKPTIREHARYAREELGYPIKNGYEHPTPAGERFVYALDNKLDIATWAALAEQAHWEVLLKDGTVVARRKEGGQMWWFKTTGGTNATLLHEGKPPVAKLTAPGKKIEDLPADKEPAFFTPLPTWKRTKVQLITDRSFEATHTPDVFVGAPWLRIDYADPDGSEIEAAQAYGPALKKAGWDVVTKDDRGGTQVAHYAKNGRDIWILFLGGAKPYIQIGDVGASEAAAKLAAALDKDGHVAIYGIYFDTDKDTLRPEADSALRQILALLKSKPKLALEVQGHTDNSGAHDHNQTLSDARATAVKTWLVAHGIAATRLTPKGYAETVPVADNKTAEGRAKNRRVELATAK